ncbi:S1C family serine protease [Actinoplanes sp. KI2]|uniref:S1C family serine protease n=1 Tax=Actinoplanes sp. KI2 TaxID=2983315 RepID=UPI0021D5DB0B|nr:S1C family serine protease [Actinoplanes sp. KI2]MCU7722837.1 S1C family serine protease [Actinoplanes sp. KI2]
MRSVGDRPVVTMLGADNPGKTDEKPKNELWRRVLIGAVAIWAAAITGIVLFRGDGGGTKAPAAARPSAAPSASDAPLTVPQIYQTVLPSLVSIRSTGKAGPAASAAKSMTESSTGTGIIANADGTILTANHVIAGAVAIQVTYTDGTTAAAEVKSADPAHDIATLTPARGPGTLVPATLGGRLDVGDPVVAMGNPLGLTASTTSGVVSGLNRTMSRDEGGDVTGLIQFDAAVNPGSSGGPLLNDRGQVAGIVVALANPTDAGTFIGIGFAVPIGAALGGGQGNGRNPPL